MFSIGLNIQLPLNFYGFACCFMYIILFQLLASNGDGTRHEVCNRFVFFSFFFVANPLVIAVTHMRRFFLPRISSIGQENSGESFE